MFLPRERETNVFTLGRRATSAYREGASCGQVEAMPRIIIRRRRKEKGIIKVAFLLLDMRKSVDLKASRKERKETKSE